MKTIKPSIHFVDNFLINPTNPVTVNVIGAGGTRGQVLTALARINKALTQLGHAGLQVTVYDDDLITAANLGRQLFAESEIGFSKAAALINRINRFFGSRLIFLNIYLILSLSTFQMKKGLAETPSLRIGTLLFYLLILLKSTRILELNVSRLIK